MPFGLSAIAIKAIGIGLLVLALIAGYALFVAHEQSIGAAENKAEVAQASLKLAQDNIAKSAQIATTQQGIAHDAQLQAGAAGAAAARAAAQRDAFRMQLDAYVSASRRAGHSAAAAGSADQPGGDAIGVLADVLGRADARADLVAKLADARRIRAVACERSYDTLMPSAP